MRWCASILITQLRYASEDLEVRGQTIKASEAVQTVLVSANRDRFPDIALRGRP